MNSVNNLAQIAQFSNLWFPRQHLGFQEGGFCILESTFLGNQARYLEVIVKIIHIHGLVTPRNDPTLPSNGLDILEPHNAVGVKHEYLNLGGISGPTIRSICLTVP